MSRLSPPEPDPLDLAQRKVTAATRGTTWVPPADYDRVFAAHPDLTDLDLHIAEWYPEETER